RRGWCHVPADIPVLAVRLDGWRRCKVADRGSDVRAAATYFPARERHRAGRRRTGDDLRGVVARGETPRRRAATCVGDAHPALRTMAHGAARTAALRGGDRRRWRYRHTACMKIEWRIRLFLP